MTIEEALSSFLNEAGQWTEVTKALAIGSLILQSLIIISIVQLMKWTEPRFAWLCFLIGFGIWFLRRAYCTYFVLFDDVSDSIISESFSFSILLPLAIGMWWLSAYQPLRLIKSKSA